MAHKSYKKHTHFTQEEIDDIISNMSIKDVSEKHNRSPQSIRNERKRYQNGKERLIQVKYEDLTAGQKAAYTRKQNKEKLNNLVDNKTKAIIKEGIVIPKPKTITFTLDGITLIVDTDIKQIIVTKDSVIINR